MSDAASPPPSPHFPVVPRHLAPKTEACVRFEYSVLASNFLGQGGVRSRFLGIMWLVSAREGTKQCESHWANRAGVCAGSVSVCMCRGVAQVNLCSQGRKVCRYMCDYEYMCVCLRVHRDNGCVLKCLCACVYA